MSFSITIKSLTNPTPQTIIAECGKPTFLLGPNGAGKSSLMGDIFRAHAAVAVRISAHRQSWLSSNVSAAPQELRHFKMNLVNWDTDPRARWMDHVADQRPTMTLSQLVNAENARARSITEAIDAGRPSDAHKLAANQSAIKTINQLFQQCNVPIAIAIKEGESIVASKSGGDDYSITQLSDGERNALLIAATVLTAPEGSLLLIDEPERHLHRSIISPLLTQLFNKRTDCAFLVSTHDVILPLDHQGCPVLLVRACAYNGTDCSGYDIDVVTTDADIDEHIKRDILGARRTIIFVEGTNESLDKPLYSKIFPTATIVSKSNCRDVERAVRGVRAASELHWVNAFGIVDGDGRSDAEKESLAAEGIHSVPAYSVESIYFHPEIQRRVAERHAGSIGGDAAKRVLEAKHQAIADIQPHLQRLCLRIAERVIREKAMKNLPTRAEIENGESKSYTIEPQKDLASEKAHLEGLIADHDLEAIINRYPVRETNALNKIAGCLGFRDRRQYEAAVLTLLDAEETAVAFVQGLFGKLASDVAASSVVEK